MILVPAAGNGERFRAAGYTGPKHLLPLQGVPMIEWVLRNVGPLDHSGETLVIDQAMVGKTCGAVETLLKVRDRVDMDSEIVVANCDQLISLDEDFAVPAEADGVIFTFKSANPAHSYVTVSMPDTGVGDTHLIANIIEKPQKPPSMNAVSGVYWFARASDLFSCLEATRSFFDGGELYLSSAIQAMLMRGLRLYARDVPTTILGTPEDFQRFEVAMAVVS